MDRCTEELMKSEYEKNFFRNRMKTSHYYCAQDEKIYLQGTRENALYQKDHAYIIYDVKRCSEATRVEGDPECAQSGEIDSWTHSKELSFRVLNKNVDFRSFN